MKNFYTAVTWLVIRQEAIIVLSTKAYAQFPAAVAH